MIGKTSMENMVPPPNGRTIWITGLSGAGKSTLADAVALQLRQAGHPIVVLDGDQLREVFRTSTSGATQHCRESRLDLAMQYGRLCQMISSQGLTVVIATISLFREVHEWNRNHLPGYFEVYLRVPLSELRRRDPKGIYRRFDSGELYNVAGLDLTIDEPEKADWIADWQEGRSVGALAEELINRLNARN